MTYVLDTNVILAYFRNHSVRYVIESVFDIYEPGAQVILPAIIIGELQSLAIQNGWGDKKREELEALTSRFIAVYDLAIDVIDRYAEIDSFSQGRLPGRKLESSARNMGKNDLWIAATASVVEATLITTDKDFDHLNNHFLNVARFELN